MCLRLLWGGGLVLISLPFEGSRWWDCVGHLLQQSLCEGACFHMRFASFRRPINLLSGLFLLQ